MYISGAKFEEHCSNVSGDIPDSLCNCLSETIYDIINFLICVIQKGVLLVETFKIHVISSIYLPS